MKFLIAGTGSIGQRHIRNLQELYPGISFILLRAGGRRDEISSFLNSPVVGSLAAALELKPDALVIATPSALHAELLLPAVAFGLPVYVEKPILTKKEDVQAVHQALDTSNYQAPSQVGCNLRFLSSLQKLRQLSQDGAIGTLVRASFEAGQWLPDWRPSQDHRKSYSAAPEGGGVILDLVHEIDAARWLFGNFSSINALATRVPSLEIASEGVAGILMRSLSGVTVSIALDYVARRPIRRYQIIGDKGTLTWDLPTMTLVLDTPTESQVIAHNRSEFDVAATYRTAMAEFVTALMGGKPTSQPIEEGLASCELAIKIKEQACRNL